MRVSRLCLVLILLIGGVVSAAARSVQPLSGNWHFLLGDPTEAMSPEWDDSTWRTLDLPHDWAFEAPFEPAAAQGDMGGYKPGGIGWYRRSFELAEIKPDQRVRVEFDGVYMNSEVWLNGERLGHRPYGYVSFGYDLTPHLRAGRNVLAVRVDNRREPSARWYHGCGIYAPVRLVFTDSLRVAPWGGAYHDAASLG